MKRFINFSSCLLFTLFCMSFSINSAPAKFVLEQNPAIGQIQLFNSSDLCQVANNTLKYIAHNIDTNNEDVLLTLL